MGIIEGEKMYLNTFSFVLGFVFSIIVFVIIGVIFSLKKSTGEDKWLLAYRDLIKPFIYLALLVFVCIFIFPTLYYYTTAANGNGHEMVYKINRITGSAQYLYPDGWRKAEAEK